MSESIGAVANHGADMLLKYAPPVLGLGAGYVVGDYFKVGDWIHGAISTGTSDAKTANKTAILLSAGLFALIAVFVWKAFGTHIIGGFLTGFFGGIAIRYAMAAMKA